MEKKANISAASTPAAWANPTPAGLIALAVACFSFFASLCGLVKKEAALLMGIWLLGGFAVQLVVALVDLKSGNTSGGNAFLYFSAFFMLVSGLENIAKALCAAKDIPLDSTIDGWPWIALTLATFLLTPAFLKASKCLFFVLLFLDIALPFIAIRDLGLLPSGLSVIPGISLLFAGLIAIYLAGASLVNAAYGRQCLPVGKPFK